VDVNLLHGMAVLGLDGELIVLHVLFALGLLYMA